MENTNNELKPTSESPIDEIRHQLGIDENTDVKTLLANVIDPSKIYKSIFLPDLKAKTNLFNGRNPKAEKEHDELLNIYLGDQVAQFLKTSQVHQQIRDSATQVMDHAEPALESWYKKTAEKLFNQTYAEILDWHDRVVVNLKIPLNTSAESATDQIKKMFEDQEKTQWLKHKAKNGKDKTAEQTIQIDTCEASYRNLDNAEIIVVRDIDTWNVIGVKFTEMFSYTQHSNENLPIQLFDETFPEDLLPKFNFSGGFYGTSTKKYPNGVVCGIRLHDYGEMQYWTDAFLKENETLNDVDVLMLCKKYLEFMEKFPRVKKRRT